MDPEIDYSLCEYAGGACKTEGKCLALELLRMTKNEEMQNGTTANEDLVKEKIDDCRERHCGRVFDLQNIALTFRFNRKNHSQLTSST